MRILISLITLLMAACGTPQPPLIATDVEVTRPMPGMQMSAGFLVITNNTDETIEISGVTSPQFESVEIHESRVEDGISRMRKLDKLLIPAGGSSTLERGGKHLMLMRPQNLRDTVTLHLMSGDARVLTVAYAFPVDQD